MPLSLSPPITKNPSSLFFSLSPRSRGGLIGCTGVVSADFDLLTKMNRCVYEQKNAFAACEEMRMESVVCPKPRRFGTLNPSINDQIRPLRWQPSCQTEISDSKAGMELLDIILTKGSFGAENPGMQVASSPPFFFGSPPSRASNPLVQDVQFGNEKIPPLSPSPLSPSSVRNGGGCARMNFGHKPAPVRVEGFNCLSRDGRNCSISAVA